MFGLKSNAHSESQIHYVYSIWFLTGLLPEFQEKLNIIFTWGKNINGIEMIG